MSNNLPHIRNNIARGSITAVLLFALLTVVSFTASAYNQVSQSPQSRTATSLANAPSSGAGPTGTVDLQWDPQTKALTAIISVSGLQPESSYANHIHAGDCSAAGKILYPLNNLATDATGSATATTTINNITGGIPASGWCVMIHNGPTDAESGLLCGNVVNTNGATEVTVPLSLMTPMP